MLSDYSYLVRFAVLIFVWAVVASKFKIPSDLTMRGLVLCLAFFTANIAVFLGYKTRLSMALLGFILAIHGEIFFDKASIVCSLLASASVFLPIGRYVSVDRYLKLGAHSVPYRPDETTRAQRLASPYKFGFLALAAFLVGGSAYNQIFHHDNRYLISWHMFHRVGKDLVLVRFHRVEGGKLVDVDYRTVLKPKLTGTKLDKPKTTRTIYGIPSLEIVIAAVCEADTAPATLRLNAKIATLINGWHDLYDGSQPICTAAGRPIPKLFPRIDTGIPNSVQEIF